MTVTTCDCCGSQIPETSNKIATLPQIKFTVNLKDHRACLFVSSQGDAMPGEPRFLCQFNTTGIAICRKCMWAAFKAEVEGICL